MSASLSYFLPDPQQLKMYIVNPETPYFVLGYGKYRSSYRPVHHAAPGSFDAGSFYTASNSSASDQSDSRLGDERIGKLPWSNAHIKAEGYAGIADLYFPPCTDFVGFASGPECFPPGSMAFLRFSCDEVTLPDFRDNVFNGARGMFYPVRYPRGGRVLCVRTVCHSHELHPRDHHISAGVSITDDCVYEMISLYASCRPGSSLIVDENFEATSANSFGEVQEKAKEVNSDNSKGNSSAEDGGPQPGSVSVPASPTPKFKIISPDHVMRRIGDNDILLKPFFIDDLPKWIRVGRRISTRDRGLTVNVKAVPCVILLICMFIVSIPGLIQYFGSDDNRWGDVLNQVIGTGSVLLGATVVSLLGSRRVLSAGFAERSISNPK